MFESADVWLSLLDVRCDVGAVHRVLRPFSGRSATSVVLHTKEFFREEGMCLMRRDSMSSPKGIFELTYTIDVDPGLDT
jgi:hypothetical protein